jgi:hypothetical protein
MALYSSATDATATPLLPPRDGHPDLYKQCSVECTRRYQHAKTQALLSSLGDVDLLARASALQFRNHGLEYEVSCLTRDSTAIVERTMETDADNLCSNA